MPAARAAELGKQGVPLAKDVQIKHEGHAMSVGFFLADTLQAVAGGAGNELSIGDRVAGTVNQSVQMAQSWQPSF